MLLELMQEYGIARIAACLHEFTDADEARVMGGELASVKEPNAESTIHFVDKSGQFYAPTPTGLKRLPLHQSKGGRPYAKVGNWTFWSHHWVYRCFVGEYDSKTHIVLPRDGDMSNCHVSNLLLAVKPQHLQGKRYGADAPPTAP